MFFESCFYCISVKMLTHAWFCAGAVVLLAGLSSVQAEVKEQFVKFGETLTLSPRSSNTLTTIVWKFNNDLLGEWLENQVDLTFYRTFKGRSKLDLKSGLLQVSKITANDTGTYTVELNGKVHDVSYNVKAIGAVKKPHVWISPRTCETKDECTATCEGDTGEDGPVTYRWWFGDKEKNYTTKEISFTRSDTKKIKTFTCQITNPVSEEKSAPENNPLFEHPNYAWVAAVVLLGLGLAGAGVGYKYREPIGQFFSRRFGGGSATLPEGPTSPTGNGSTAENTPLAKTPEPPVPKNAPEKDRETADVEYENV